MAVQKGEHVYFFRRTMYNLSWRKLEPCASEIDTSRQSVVRRTQFSASEMTYIVSGGALNSTHSLTLIQLASMKKNCWSRTCQTPSKR